MDRTDLGRFEQFFRLCSDPACILDEQGRFEDVNLAWEKALGYRHGELAGRPFIDLIKGDDRPRVDEAMRVLLERRGTHEAIELRVLRKDGREQWALWSAWGEQGERRVHATLHDLTAARHLEGQLREEVKFNKALLDTSPIFFAAISGDGKTLMMNQFMRAALGYTEEEVLGQDYMSMCVPERDQEPLKAIFDKLTQERSPTISENRVRAKDGREILVEWRGQPYVNAEGQLDYFIGVGVEVGERRRMEKALRRSEQKLSFHIQQTPLGVIEWDVNFKIVDWNASATRIFGFTKEEVLGQSPVGLIIDEREAAAVTPIWKDLLEFKRATPEQRALIPYRGAVRGKNENITKDGRVIICEWYLTPLVNEEGEVTGVMSLVDDVTEEAVLAAELRRRERAQAETIQRLSTPVIEVWDRILTLPIIGAIDAERAGRMTEELLGAIVRTRAAFTIVDVTGMEAVDPENAEYLLKMVRATELLGSRCLISGISPAAAQTMVNLEIALTGLVTFGTLRDALSYALAHARSKA